MQNSDRIKQVRELFGWTQNELAELIQKDQSLIAQIEGGRKEASEQLIRLIAFKTGFPPNFFKQEIPSDLSFGSLALRAHASLTKRQKLKAYRYAQLAFEFAEKVGKNVSRVPVDLPRLDVEPIDGARIMRSHIGLSPDRPIGQLINVIERLGVLVVLLPINLPNLDAFSLWGSNRTTPIIAMSASRSGDRARFSVSHELWHLVSLPKGKPVEIEKNADQFAAEFLTPAMGIKKEFLPPITLTSIGKLKTRWGVSMSSLIRRAFELEVISERQYYYYMQQMSMKGWRIKEPVQVPFEKPTALPRIIEKGQALAKDTLLSSAFIKTLLAPYAP